MTPYNARFPSSRQGLARSGSRHLLALLQRSAPWRNFFLDPEFSITLHFNFAWGIFYHLRAKHI